MNKSKIFFTLLFCISLISILPLKSKAQERVDVDKWVQEASIDTQKGAIFSYTYQVKVTYDRNKKWGFGRKFIRLYEAIVPAHFSLTKPYTHPLVLIDDSETPISQESINNARKELVKELERAESVVDKPEEKVENYDGGYWTIQLRSNELKAKVDIFNMLKAAQFSNPQIKEIDGHEILAIDFSPKPETKLDPVLDYFTQIEGQVWIDKETKRIIRMEGFYIGTFKDIREKQMRSGKMNQSCCSYKPKLAKDFGFRRLYDWTLQNIPIYLNQSNWNFSSATTKKQMLI